LPAKQKETGEMAAQNKAASNGEAAALKMDFINDDTIVPNFELLIVALKILCWKATDDDVQRARARPDHWLNFARSQVWKFEKSAEGRTSFRRSQKLRPADPMDKWLVDFKFDFKDETR